jgi:hypothetical protein
VSAPVRRAVGRAAMSVRARATGVGTGWCVRPRSGAAVSARVRSIGTGTDRCAGPRSGVAMSAGARSAGMGADTGSCAGPSGGRR